MLRPLSRAKSRATLQRDAYFTPVMLTASRRWVENVNCGSVETKCSTLRDAIAADTNTASHAKATAQMRQESKRPRSLAISPYLLDVVPTRWMWGGPPGPPGSSWTLFTQSVANSQQADPQ